MEQLEFLDLTGTDRVIKNTVEIIKNHTSDNDIHFSSDEKNNLEQSYAHSTSKHAPTDAEKNIIVGVQKNGEDLIIDSSRKVNITVPTKLSELENDLGLEGGTGSNITVDSELSDTSENPVQNKVIKEVLDEKVDKIDGKDLSTNDYTNIDKEKLSTIAEGAEVNVQSDWNETDTTSDAYIKNKPTSLPANGGNADTVNGHSVESNVPSNAKFTDTVYDDTSLSNRVKTIEDNYLNSEDKEELETAIETAKNSANSYTDSKVNGLASTTVVDNKVSAHNTSTSAHSDIRGLITDLTTRLNALANSTDEDLDQMAEIVAYIKANKSLIDSITTSKINVTDIVDNLTTASSDKVLSANQGVVIKGLIDALQSELDSHTHVIADVSGLQGVLDGKAEKSHGTHVSYSTTTPVMDGTASVGSASSVARSDHKHPTDTSRASQSDLTSHTGDTTKHITSTERTNWNSAKTHADSAHAPSNAQANQNAFSNVKVGSTTISADAPTDTLELVAGSNINLTPDTTNDKITITAKDTVYTHPSYTSKSSGLYKITVDSTGHISSATAVAKSDITALGIPSSDTNTHYTSKNVVAGSSTTTSNTTSALGNGSVYLISVENGVATSAHKISGSGATTVTTDASGNIVISSTDTNTTYTLSSFGITATATEINKLDGLTATTTELNYVDGVTSNIQTQLDGKAASSHGTHVTWSTTMPKANGTATVGTETKVARGDHVHPLQTTVSGNSGSTTKLATARTIDGVSFNGTAAITHYGTCSTAAATVAKTVTLTGFTLVTGARVMVKFTVTNTASSPTLNVNSTGAKAIMYRGSAITSSYLAANRVYEFVYDGTDWELVGDINTDSNTKNTAGSTNTSSKIFLIGATSQAANPQTYSHDTAYIGTDGCLYSGGVRVRSEINSSTEPTGQVEGDYWSFEY